MSAPTPPPPLKGAGTSGNTTLSALVKEVASKYPSNLALQKFGRKDPNGDLSESNLGLTVKITFKELVDRFEKLGAVLRDSWAVRPGNRVALLSENNVEWVISYFAASSIGATVVQLDPSLPSEDIDELIRRSDTSALLLSERGYEKIKDFDYPDSAGPMLNILQDFEPFRTVQAPEPRSAQDDDPRVATVIFTSGTTGKPKGVLLAHESIIFAAQSFTDLFPIDDTDAIINALPLHHIFPFMAQIAFLRIGACATYIEDLLPEFISGALATVRPTLLVFVPRFYESFYTKITTKVREAGGLKPCLFFKCFPLCGCMAKTLYKKVHAVFGGRVRFCISGGAPLSVEVGEAYNTWGMKVCEGYGMSETAALIAVNPPDKPKLGTVGKSVPNTQIRLGERDEVQFKGMNNMIGYFRDPEKTKETFTDDGWLRTGDVGQVDKEGYLSIVGRIKELIVTAGGKKISPFYVEEKYGQVTGVTEYAVFGKKLEGENAEDVHAAVVVDHDHFTNNESKAEMEKVIRDKFSTLTTSVEPMFRIHRIHFLDALPRTAGQKVKRNLLAGMCAEEDEKASGDTPADDGDTAMSDTCRVVIRIMDPLRPDNMRDPIKPLSGLQFVGLDSLGLMGACSKVAAELKIEMTYLQVLQYKQVHQEIPLDTVKDLADFIDQVIAGTIKLTTTKVDLVKLEKDVADISGTNGYPASGFQRQCWAVEMDDIPSYITSRAFKVIGKLDVNLLQQALSIIIDRHDLLRASFHAPEDSNGSDLRVRVHPKGEVKLTLEIVDANSLSDDDAREKMNDVAAAPFDFTQAPLIRAALFKKSDEDHSLVVAIHHLVIDMLSWFFVMEELACAYSFLEKNLTPVFPTIPADYRHFLALENNVMTSADGDAHLAYWRKHMTSITSSHLGTGNEPSMSNMFTLSPDVAKSLSEVATRYGCSMFAVLLTGYYIILHRFAQEPANVSSKTIQVCSAYSLRNKEEFAAVVGPMINELVLNLDVDLTVSFADLLEAAKKVSQDALSHQEAPFGIVGDKLGYSFRTSKPGDSGVYRFKYCLTYYSFANTRMREFDIRRLLAGMGGAAQSIGKDLQMQPMPLALTKPTGGNHLYLFYGDTADGGIAGTLRYDPTVFAENDIGAICGSLQNVLTKAAQDATAPVSSLL